MTPLPPDIFTALSRYLEEYHWNWLVARKVINWLFDARYTRAELQDLYRRSKCRTRYYRQQR